jgi:tRNA threonylcarbamoyladenosine biosynthesis protein TsaE
MTTLTVAEREAKTTTRSTVSTVRGEYESGDPRDTENLGAKLAAGLSAGDVVLVAGEIGAGKTTFVRGACRALGIRVPVTSPTFTIGQRYRGPVTVSHLDLFRVPGLAGEDPDLLADYLGPDTIAFIEWPQGGEDAVSAYARIAAWVRLEHAGGERRRVVFEC